jgi:subtilisin family serine protease
MNKPKRSILLVTALVAGATALVIPQFRVHLDSGIPDPSHPASRPGGALTETSPDRAPSAAPSEIYPAETSALLESAFAQALRIKHGGRLREFILANDELHLRGKDGSTRLVAIPPAASGGELLLRMEEKRDQTSLSPELILYPEGLPRSASNRRIVTREVMLEAGSRTAADALASASGLSFKAAPAYAPGKFIYEAASSPEALAFFVKTSGSTSPYVTPLLASRAFPMNMPNDPLAGRQWHLRNTGQVTLLPGGLDITATAGIDLNVFPLWNYPASPNKKPFDFNSANNTNSHIRGNKVVIGIVDDGMEWTHGDLRPNVVRNLQRDWNGKDFDPTPLPADSHGTACAGVAAARGNNRIGVCGVAPEAGLAGLRLIAAPQTDLDIAESIIWKSDAIHIKSNSWGYYAFEEDPLTGEFLAWNPIFQNDPLTEAALEYAANYGRGARGTIMTFAAGNYDEMMDSTGAVSASGARVDFQALPNSIYTIAVGAISSLGIKSNYSQIGSSLLVSAPSNTTDGTGLGIMTTDNKGRGGDNYGIYVRRPTLPTDDFKGNADLTESFGGTSSATPAVSGVIALMLQRNPTLGWRDVQEILILSANRTFDTTVVWDTNAAGIEFSDDYGSGMVDAVASVALSGNWTNLGPQQSQTVTRNTITQSIAPGATVTRTFTVNGANLRTEHATLEMTVTDLPKGNLTITLTSPQNTVSTFCLPHSDTVNTLTDWKFMTVRNWGERSNGIWTLSVTNNSPLSGNLTATELVVYGAAPVQASNVVTLAASSTFAPLGVNITLNATASALAPNGTLTGNITGVRFFQTLNGTTTLIGNGTLTANSSANPATYSIVWNTANLTAGNYSLTAEATSSANVTGTSPAVAVTLEPRLLAGWDFQTASSVSLTNALYSTRTYRANFGTGNGTLFMNGANGSSRWNVSAGEVFSGNGSTLNAGAGFSQTTTNPAALLLRAGKARSANGKSLVFQVNMSGSRRLGITYATAASAGSFTTHTWQYLDAHSSAWQPLHTHTFATRPSAYSIVTIPVATRAGFDGQANAQVRLTVSGANRAEATNLIDNIRFSATSAP